MGEQSPLPPQLARALACPQCHGQLDATSLFCETCGISFPRADGVPVLLRTDHPWRPVSDSSSKDSGTNDQGVSRLVRRASPIVRLIALARRHAPEQRVWSRQSKRAINRALTEARQDTDHLTVNLGAGLERVFQEAFAQFPEVVRIGLPHAGAVDAYGDVMALPLVDASVGLFMSCSVMEHVQDPDDGVAEMSRVIRSGGLVYAEIPFLRSYHMMPHDYQRYTISGIERLFARHGFDLVEKGVCSGPFTAWALFVYDSVCSLSRVLPKRVRFAVQGGTSILVHPFKYLDRLVERSPQAENQACNFYYLGRRI